MNKETGLLTIDGVKNTKTDGTEEIFYIPYNVNNILINEQNVILLLSKYQVYIDKIYNIELFREAMTHKSYLKHTAYSEGILNKSKKELRYPKNLLELRDKSYERLEYLGDSIIKVIISMYLFHRYPDEDEGFMTTLKIHIENKNNLARMARDMQLSKYFIISKQIEMAKGREAEKFNEDIFESFFGALFLSNGFNPCLQLMLNLLESQIDYSEKLYNNVNYKTQLLMYYHAQEWGHPEYYLVEQYGQTPNKIFIMAVKMGIHNGTNIKITNDNKIELAQGFGQSSRKKDAEQNASKMALILLGCLNEDQYLPTDLFYPNMTDIQLKIKKDIIYDNNKDINIENNIKTKDIINTLIFNDQDIL